MVQVGNAGTAKVEQNAGAFGNPQFLPSVYLRLAKDGDGDGRADIMGNRADTFASIANYFRDAGWRADQPWGVRASVTPGFDVASYRTHRGPFITRLDAPVVYSKQNLWKGHELTSVMAWQRAARLDPLAADVQRSAAVGGTEAALIAALDTGRIAGARSPAAAAMARTKAS